MRTLLLLAGLLSSLQGGERLYWCRIHDPASAVDFYGNATGGGRSRFGELAELQVQNAGPEAWRLEFSANHGLWTSGGLVNAVGRAIEDRATLRPQALWHPLIRAEFQPHLLALRVEVRGASSPAGRSDLELRLELKGYDDAGEQENLQAFTVPRAQLLKGPFPRRFEFPADDVTDPFGLLVLLLDRAVAGDTLELGRIEAQVALPEQPPARRGMLLGLRALLANWDEASGLVQDRGKETVNWLKGSWNLSLFTEGWLFSQPANRQAARQALAAIPEFAGAWNRLFPPRQAATSDEAFPTGPVPQ